MPGLFPNPLYLTKTKRSELEKLVKKHSTPQQIALRARIIMLADELIKRNIVESISPRHVGRLPDEPDLKPHQTR
jgi:hypothetical protein